MVVKAQLLINITTKVSVNKISIRDEWYVLEAVYYVWVVWSCSWL